MSEDKIIARRNRLIEWQKTQEVRSSVLYEIVDENISSINYLLYQLQQKENIIKEVREYINDNVMVYAFNDKKFPHWDFNDDNINDILEILDKVD